MDCICVPHIIATRPNHKYRKLRSDRELKVYRRPDVGGVRAGGVALPCCLVREEGLSVPLGGAFDPAASGPCMGTLGMARESETPSESESIGAVYNGEVIGASDAGDVVGE